MSPWGAAYATAAVSSSPRNAERIRSDTTGCLLSSSPGGDSHLILRLMRRMAFLLVLLASALTLPDILQAQAPAAPSADTAARRTPVVAVAEKVSPAVVNISAESTVREADPFFGLFFGPTTRSMQALGSGLIIDASGIVVTNAHVIEGASRIQVTTLDG